MERIVIDVSTTILETDYTSSPCPRSVALEIREQALRRMRDLIPSINKHHDRRLPTTAHIYADNHTTKSL